MWNKLGILSILLLIALGCKTRKPSRLLHIEGEYKISRSAYDAVQQQITTNRPVYKTFNSRARSTVRINKSQHDVTTHLRIKRDESIWLSVTATLGVEVARVWITPDSIAIINRLQSTYIKQPFSYIYSYTGGHLSFFDLQELFTAEVPETIQYDKPLITGFTDGHVLRKQQDDIAFETSINKQYRPISVVLNRTDQQQQLQAFYENYNQFSERLFPQNIQLSFSGDRLELQIDMTYNRIVLDEPIEQPFQIPSRYQEITHLQ